VAQLQPGGGAGLDRAEAVCDRLTQQVGGGPAVHPRRGVDPRLAGAVIDDREHRAAPSWRVQASVGSVAHSSSGVSVVMRPVCRRLERLRTCGVGASSPASRISRSTRLAARADAAQPEPGAELLVPFANERRLGDLPADRD
jgi:hypothetical protein